MNSQLFSVKQYSLLALGLVVSESTKAQIIYKDIEPDVILNEDEEIFLMDLDDNGTDDFKLHHKSGLFIHVTGFSSSYIVEKEINQIFPVDENEAQIAGSTDYTIWFLTSTAFNPYAFSKKELINDENFTPNWGIPIIAAIVRSTEDNSLLGYHGNWFPQLKNHYIGVKFKADDEQFHFGWIRCSVRDSAEALVIKDYAYEIQPAYSIPAGDTIHYVALNEINSLNASVYSFNSKIFIHLTENNETELHIYNLMGEEIYSDMIIHSHTEIEVKEKGVFIVELIDGEKRLVKKILLD